MLVELMLVAFFVFGRKEDILKQTTATTTISRLPKPFKIKPKLAKR